LQSTAVKLSLKMLSCIEATHRHNLVHRQIKPSNFAFRVPESERLVLLDFGLAKRIFDAATQKHFHDSVSHGTVGTFRYQSFYGPQGQQISAATTSSRGSTPSWRWRTAGLGGQGGAIRKRH
jgi:serine/threonine protein kinase